MTSRKMKNSGVFLLMLLLLLAIVERPALVEAGPDDCLDACQTGCVASYLPDSMFYFSPILMRLNLLANSHIIRSFQLGLCSYVGVNCV